MIELPKLPEPYLWASASGSPLHLEETMKEYAQKAIEAYRAALLEHAATKTYDHDFDGPPVDFVEDLMWELERKGEL